MKKIAIAILGLTALASCNKEVSNTLAQPQNFMDSVSYSIGYNFGEGYKKEMGDKMDSLNLDAMILGLRNGVDSTGLFTPEQMGDIMRDFKLKLNEAMEAQAKKENEILSKEHDAFMEEVSKRDSIVTLPSGLMYKIISEGPGSKPDANDTTVVNYVGKFSDGEIFDANKPGEAARFVPLGLVPGLIEGLPLMSIGSKYEFYIPQNLGYGERGIPKSQGFKGIAPFSPIVFEIELLDVVSVSEEVHEVKMKELQARRMQMMQQQQMQQQLQQQR